MVVDAGLFDQAVVLTAAFVANGDIRYSGKGDKDDVFNKVGSMVELMYDKLKETKESIAAS